MVDRLTTEGPLSGKVAVVTGGSKGIGRAIAAALIQRGAQVVLTSRNSHEASAAASALGETAIGRACDVCDEASVEQLFAFVGERFGAVDVLVNNAGIAGP